MVEGPRSGTDDHSDAVKEAVAAVAEARRRLAQLSYEEFVSRAIEWLWERWGDDRLCPYCGNREWEVGTPIDMSPTSGEAATPHFSVTCTNCAQTTFINAVRAGLLPEPTGDS